MVTTQGFNALLKLVEEPPPHLKFIFATTEPDKVIGTIRSRTHHYPFRLVPPKVLADYMATLCVAEGVAIESAALPLVVRAGAGSVRDSLSVLDQLIGGAGPEGVTYELAVALLGFTPDSLLDACVDGIAAHDSAAVFETIEKVIETGQDPKRFAEDLLRRLRDLVVLSAVPNAVASGLIEAAEDQGERLQTQAAGIGPAELTRAADIVAAGLLEMRGATAPRLQLELICAKVLLPGADDSTNGIQARLDRMERRLAIGAPAGTTDAAQAPAVGTATSAQPPAAGTAPVGQPPASGASTPGAAAPGGVASGGGSDDSGVPGAEAASSRAAARAAATGGGTPQEVSADSPADDAPAGPADRAAGGAGTGSAAPTPATTHSAGPAGSGAAAGASDSSAARGAGSGVGSAGGGRTGAWGDGADASSDSPVPSDVAAGGGGAGAGAVAAPAGAGGPVGLADIRRLWPEILEAVKSKRRFAWIMLSQNAQVIAIDDQTLTLGLVNAGARESFARSGSDDILRQAMVDTIGVDRRVEAVVDPSSDPGAGGSGGRPGGSAPGGSGGGAAGGSGGGAPGGHGGGAPRDAGGAPAGGTAGGAPGGYGGDATGGGRGPEAPGMGGSGASGSQTGGPGAAGPGIGGPDANGSDVGGGPAVAGSAASGLHGPGAGEVGAGGPADRVTAGGGADGAAAAGAAVGGSAPGASAPGGSDGGVAGEFGEPGQGGGAGAVGGAALGGGADGRGSASGLGASAGGSGGPGAGREWADGAGSVALQEPPDSEYDVPPGVDPWEGGRGGGAGQAAPVERREQAAPVDRREQAASKRRAAEAAVAAEQARAAARAPAVPEVPLTPEEEAASIGEDDVVLDDDPRTHTDLLRETLGAQIITEEPN